MIKITCTLSERDDIINALKDSPICPFNFFPSPDEGCSENQCENCVKNNIKWEIAEEN